MMKFGVKNLVLLGSGESLNHVVPHLPENPDIKTLALQRVFPYCHKIFGVIPDYWNWFDANGSLDGLEYILKNHQSIDFKKMVILIPKFVCESYEHYRKFAGTTPLGRNPADWDLKYRSLLNQVEKIVEVKKFDATTTKRIALAADVKNRDLSRYDIHESEAYIRFMNDDVLFGTVRFDSEKVIGTTFKWGMESKLSSVMLPVAYYLKAKNVYVCGVDFKGARFYDKTRSRHAWGKDVKEINPAVKYALLLISKWTEWQDIHGMTISSLAPKELSLLSNILPVVDAREIT
jgi:hypothetical protein